MIRAGRFATRPQPSPAATAQDRRQLAGELAAMLEQIRALDGFASFGLPPATGELLAQAASRPGGHLQRQCLPQRRTAAHPRWHHLAWNCPASPTRR